MASLPVVRVPYRLRRVSDVSVASSRRGQGSAVGAGYGAVVLPDDVQDDVIISLIALDAGAVANLMFSRVPPPCPPILPPQCAGGHSGNQAQRYHF